MTEAHEQAPAKTVLKKKLQHLTFPISMIICGVFLVVYFVEREKENK